MATGQYHTGGYPVEGGDMPAANYGTTDIEAGLIVLIDTTNQFTPALPMGVVLPTAGGGVVGTWGITIDRLPAKPSGGVRGPAGRVRVYGVYPVLANGAITAGGYVQASDTALKLGYAKACAAATEQIGQAMNTVADGETCFVLIAKAKNA